MNTASSIFTVPLLLFVFAVSAFLGIQFRRGHRKNYKIYHAAFSELMEIFCADDQVFTNIGGSIGHHANFYYREKGLIYEIDATITLLPRHAPLYLPISEYLMRNDRLFISLYMRYPPPGEGHIIEKSYDGFRGHEITNVVRLSREEIFWGPYPFFLYYDKLSMYDALKELLMKHRDPGNIRHVALIPDQRKGFIFMIPREGTVKRDCEPVYHWMCRLFEKQRL